MTVAEELEALRAEIAALRIEVADLKRGHVWHDEQGLHYRHQMPCPAMPRVYHTTVPIDWSIWPQPFNTSAAVAP